MNHSKDTPHPDEIILEVVEETEEGTATGTDEGFRAAKAFLETLPATEEDQEIPKPLMERRLEEAEEVNRWSMKELQKKEENIDDLEVRLRKSKRQFRLAMLALGILGLTSGGIIHQTLKKQEPENIRPNNEKIISSSSEGTSSVSSVMSGEKKEKNQQWKTREEKIRKLQEELKEAKENIRKIDAWISQQTEEDWKGKGWERRSGWQNYVDHLQSEIILAQDEVMHLLKEESR